MRNRLREPAVPVAGMGIAVTSVLWITAGTPTGLVALVATIVLSCTARYLDHLETIRRDQHVRDLAEVALNEHSTLAATSTPTGLEVRVAPLSKEIMNG